MSDLIYKEDVIKIIDEEIKAKSDYLQHNAQIDIMYKVQELPTVEAKPVVHCKDCEHWGTGIAGETEHVKCCEYGKYMVGENGYCCYADMRKKVK